RTVDRDVQVLAPGGEDLRIQQRVPGVVAERGPGQVVRAEGGQDADHHDVRALGAGPFLGVVQAGPQVGLQLVRGVTGKCTRPDVDLDVEPAELGLEVRVGDRGQNVGVLHRRVVPGVDQVELDLQAGQRTLEVELRLGEHPGEDVQAAPDLRPIPLPVLAGELSALDVLAHAGTSLVCDLPACADGCG